MGGGRRMREHENEGHGEGGAITGGRGAVTVGVLSRKGSRHSGCVVAKGMSLWGCVVEGYVITG